MESSVYAAPFGGGGKVDFWIRTNNILCGGGGGGGGGAAAALAPRAFSHALQAHEHPRTGRARLHAVAAVAAHADH